MRINTYTKRDIAKKLGSKLGLSTRKSLVYTNEVFNVLRELLCEDKPYIRIEVRNFGVLESKPTKAKPRARNPKTNEEIFVPAHKKTRFKPGKILKDHHKNLFNFIKRSSTFLPEYFLIDENIWKIILNISIWTEIL